MELRKITLAMIAALMVGIHTAQAQDTPTYNYRSMPREQFENRLNNAKIEYEQAKASADQAKSAFAQAKEAYKQAKKSYADAKKNEKMKKKALKEAQKALKYRTKLRNMGN